MVSINFDRHQIISPFYANPKFQLNISSSWIIYNAAIHVGNLFDVYHHNGFLSQRLFKTFFRYKRDIIIYS
jgi:hypothetical protein